MMSAELPHVLGTIDNVILLARTRDECFFLVFFLDFLPVNSRGFLHFLNVADKIIKKR